MPQSSVLETNTATANSSQNRLSYIDNNIFYNYSNLSWRLGNGSTADTIYTDLASWNMASSHPELESNPDENALLDDPDLIDPSRSNYQLSPNSPARDKGRFGMSIGADFNYPLNANQIDNACIQRTF